MDKKLKLKLNIVLVIIGILFLSLSESIFGSYQVRILNLCAIYIVLAVSLNLINGYIGMLSLGSAGFMALGAYASALLTMSAQVKEMNFFLTPIVPILANVELPFIVALLIGGILSAFVAFLIGFPVLKLTDDYLAIATLGFGEIIRVVFTNLQSITNGPLGLKGLPDYTNIYWSWGWAVFTVIVIGFLIKGSYGKSFKAIRENEIAAKAVGINVMKYKLMAFVISAFFTGIGGGLLAHLIGTIDPLMFRFILTFNIVLIIVLGGLGSVSGSIIGSIIFVIALEGLRFLDAPMNFGLFTIPGVPGTRMVVFSAILLFIILFYRKGIMGRQELSWEKVCSVKSRFKRSK